MNTNVISCNQQDFEFERCQKDRDTIKWQHSVPKVFRWCLWELQIFLHTSEYCELRKSARILNFSCIIYLENLSHGLQEQTKIFLTKTLRNLKGYGRKTCGKNNHTLFTTTWNQWSQETSSIHIYTDILTLVNFKFSKEI